MLSVGASLIALILCSITWRCWSVITLENNGYKGIMVAIHHSVEENYTLVENLKSLLSSASSSLYDASRNRAYFAEVTIAVPPGWSRRPEYESVAGGSRFPTAHVRIDHPNPEYGNNPYTLQPGVCGEEGQYVHLTPEFVLELHGITTEEYGDPGKTLVHEWAHFRYGVFDEFAGEDSFQLSSFYMDEDNRIRPTGCSSKIQGWLRNETLQRCNLGADGLPDEECLFWPDIEEVDVRSSLMYMHWLPSVDTFCDDDADFEHNALAPNKHNLMCNGRSVWNVITSHSDFQADANPPKAGLNTKPKFRIIQPRANEGNRFVLVLDISGSMSGRRMNMLYRAASLFVREQIPKKSYLGIVAFSTAPRIIAEMTKITKSSRKKLLRVLPRKDDEGYTGIGLGLQAALQLLSKDQSPTEGAVIILITDGEENVPPFIQDITSSIKEAGVIINTIAFGANASHKVEHLVWMTEGRGFFYSDADIAHAQTVNLQSALFTAVATQTDPELQPLEVSNQMFTVNPYEEATGTITIDPTIGSNTRFHFGYSYPDVFAAALTGPTGSIYAQNSSEYKDDTNAKIITFTIPKAESGKWTYTIQNNFHVPQRVGVSTTSEAHDPKEPPIRARAWLNTVDFDSPHNASKAKVFAEVKKGYNAIVGATVMAYVERPIESKVEIALLDNGIGADVTADDGIYTAHFTDFNEVGRYSAAAHVLNDGHAQMKVGCNGGSRALKARKLGLMREKIHVSSSVQFKPIDLNPPVTKATSPSFEMKPVEEFERTSNAGAFQLKTWSPGDHIPPGRVLDLKVVSLSVEEGIVSLEWTAPGDDMEHGTVNRTELRFHPRVIHLRDSFHEAFPVNSSVIVNGSLDPLQAGKTHSVTVRLSSLYSPRKLQGLALFFGVRCTDEADNMADLSNIAPAYFAAKKPFAQHFGNAKSPVNVNDEASASKGLTPGQITLLIVGLVAVAVAVVVGTLILRAKQRQKKELFP